MKMTDRGIRNFINYHYQPLTIFQIAMRLIVVGILNAACCILGSDRYAWAIVILIPNLLLVGIMLYILRTGIHKQNSRFLWDGATYTYISVILNLIAYRIITWKSGGNLGLLLSFLLVLFLSFATVGILVFQNIRNDRYSEQSSKASKSVAPYLLSLIGFLLAKHCLSAVGSQIGIQIIVIALLFLSALIGIGWGNLIKLALNCKRMIRWENHPPSDEEKQS